jgi:hypothetical protein
VAMIVVIVQDNFNLIVQSLHMILSTKCKAAELKASRSNALQQPLPSVTFPTPKPSVFRSYKVKTCYSIALLNV